MTLIFADMVPMLYLGTINNLFTCSLANYYKNHTFLTLAKFQDWT